MYYFVQVDKRIPPEEGSAFKRTVERVLNDERGWDQTFHRVQTMDQILSKPKKKAFVIRLTLGDYLNKMYPDFSKDQLSVANMTDHTIDINYCRWTEQCPNQSGLPIDQYHEYVILHEVGHILGKEHPTESQLEKLDETGEAPVMMQQTLGIQNFTPNSWPTSFDKKVL